MTTARTHRLKTGGTTNRRRPRFTFTGRIADFAGTGRRTDYFHFHCTSVDFPFTLPGFQFRLAMSEDEKKTVRIEDKNDRWRFTCPRGHRDWEPTNHHFWCATCARAEGVDGVFNDLRDQTSGELYGRDDVRLLTPVGPYDRDPEECEAAHYSKMSTCPSARSPHDVRSGRVTAHRLADEDRSLVSDRMDASEDILDKHYDRRSKRQKAEQRRRLFDL